jgi:predicted transcriptional regulator
MTSQPPKKSKTVSYTFRIDEDDLAHLKAIAKRHDRSVAYIVKYALKHFINNQRPR